MKLQGKQPGFALVAIAIACVVAGLLLGNASFNAQNGIGTPGVSMRESRALANAELPVAASNLVGGGKNRLFAASAQSMESQNSARDPARPFVGELVARAVDTGDGALALKAAALVRECQFLELELQSTQRAMASSRELAATRQQADRYMEMMARMNQCQALVVEPVELQHRLVEIALADRQIGAAAAALTLGVIGDGALYEKVAADAIAGDVESVVHIISRSPRAIGVTPELHQALTHALLLARHDSRLVSVANAYLEVATSWAAARQATDPEAASQLAKSMMSRPTEATSMQAKAILDRLRLRQAVDGDGALVQR